MLFACMPLYTGERNDEIGAGVDSWYIPSQTLRSRDFGLSSEEQRMRLLSMGILPGTLCFLLGTSDKRVVYAAVS